MLAAVGWGALAASSLLLGALLAFARPWPSRQVGLVLAFGAGALISAVSFELAAEGVIVGSAGSTAAGLAAGALTYYALDGALASRMSSGRGRSGRAESSEAGVALALGAFLDGIPEQLVLGIGLAAGNGVGVGLLVAIFVSNLPEAIGSATGMHTSKRNIIALWLAVAAVCALATVAGLAIADSVSGKFQAGINGFAAGALLVMLTDSMFPEARKKGGNAAGLVTVLGFAVAAALTTVA
jgi:ZIP family zinc transporter